MVEIQENAVEGMVTLIESRGYMYEHKMHRDIITKNYVKKGGFAATLHDAGSHFAPEIVEVFLKLRPKVEAHYKNK